MQTNSFLLYGANGYTGKLIAAEAAKHGLQPILAGRNKTALQAMANEYGWPYRVADLDNEYELIDMLQDVQVVLHAAGPFRYTAQPMIKACLLAGVHYIDITGEIKTFELTQQHHEQAANKNIMLLPGAGFDVVPTDCLALYLKNKLPDAHSLQLAFATQGSGVSQGTAKSITEKLGEASVVRRNGKLMPENLGASGKWLHIKEADFFVMSAPLGDVFTAFYSTGILNIDCFVGVKPGVYKMMQWQWLFNPLLRTKVVKNFIRQQIKKRPAGPTPEQRAKSKSFIWGQVQNASGHIERAGMITTNGYSFTSHSSLIAVKKILQGEFKAGYQTPASAFGANWVLEVPGTTRFDL